MDNIFHTSEGLQCVCVVCVCVCVCARAFVQNSYYRLFPKIETKDDNNEDNIETKNDNNEESIFIIALKFQDILQTINAENISKENAKDYLQNAFNLIHKFTDEIKQDNGLIEEILN